MNGLSNLASVGIQNWTNCAKKAMAFSGPLGEYLSPRRYVPPAGYVNPMVFGLFMGGELLADSAGHGNTTDHYLAAGAITLYNHNVPTYFVANDFAEAALQTAPPKEGTLADVQWPLDALLFVLPVEFTVKEFGFAVPFLAICKIPQGEVKAPKEFRMSVQVGDNGMAMSFYAVMNSRAPTFYHRRAPMDCCIAPFVDDDDEIKVGRGIYEFAGMENIMPQLDEAAERDLLRKLNGFAVKLLLAMSSEPELVEVGTIERKGRVKHGKTVTELWSPNFIGRKYSHGRESLGGEHASPRLHWRRGHNRWQRFGEGRTKRKLLWIRPVLVNAITETTP